MAEKVSTIRKAFGWFAVVVCLIVLAGVWFDGLPILMSMVPSRTLVVPDKYPTIQEAIDAAWVGDTVYVKNGTYFGGFNLKSDMSLVGEDKDTVILQTEGRDRCVLWFANCSNATVSNVTVEHTGSDHRPRRIPVVMVERKSSGPNKMQNCRIRNGVGCGVCIHETSSMILEDCEFVGHMHMAVSVGGDKSSLQMRRCNVHGNFQQGVTVSNSAHCVIEDSSIFNNHTCGIDIHGGRARAEITNCEVNYNGEVGIKIRDNAVADIEQCTVQGHSAAGICSIDGHNELTCINNICRKNGMGGIFIMGSTQGNIKQNTCENNGIAGITIGGIDSQNTASERMQDSYLWTRPGSNASKKAKQVSEIFILENECSNNLGDGIRIFHKRHGFLVRDNKCENNREYGMSLRQCGGRFVVAGNECSGNSLMGLALWQSTGGVVEGNRCTNNADSGVYLVEASDLIVRNNISEENAGRGIMVDYSRAVDLTGNECKKNMHPGIVVASSIQARLQGNNCIANGDAGILFMKQAQGEIRENICDDNVWCGIGVRGSDRQVAVANNTCRENGAWGIICWAGSTPSLSGNTLENNAIDNVKWRN